MISAWKTSLDSQPEEGLCWFLSKCTTVAGTHRRRQGLQISLLMAQLLRPVCFVQGIQKDICRSASKDSESQPQGFCIPSDFSSASIWLQCRSWIYSALGWIGQRAATASTVQRSAGKVTEYQQQDVINTSSDFMCFRVSRLLYSARPKRGFLVTFIDKVKASSEQ